jgi:hypothetical protein
MHRVSLMAILLAVAAILALPACSNRKGAMLDPSSGGNSNGGSTMGGSGY